MVADLRWRGRWGKGLMFVSYYGKSRAFIANSSSWREYDSVGKTAEVASSIISHESIHLALNKFSVHASDKLDNLFAALIHGKFILMVRDLIGPEGKTQKWKNGDFRN